MIDCLLFVSTVLAVLGSGLIAGVPLNNKLAAVKPESAEGASFWTEFRATWGLWNHVRWIGALAAAASFIMALVEGGTPLPSRE